MELMSPFHLGWMKEVVHRHAHPNRAKIYYWSPDGIRLRSHNDTIRYFLSNPHDHLSERNFSWKKKLLGINDQQFERVQQASPQGTPPPKPPPPTSVFNEYNIFHKHPGDILMESWGIVKQPTESEEDINTNRRELKEEHKAYENAKESHERRHSSLHYSRIKLIA